jgi:hypothetical protein
MSRTHTLNVLLACRLNDARQSLPPWRYGGSTACRRNPLAAAHSVMCVRLPAPQEWLPVEALPELVAELDTPGVDDGQRLRSRRSVGN